MIVCPLVSSPMAVMKKGGVPSRARHSAGRELKRGGGGMSGKRRRGEGEGEWKG